MTQITEEQLAAWARLAYEARKEVLSMCEGDNWRMSIPVREDDSDRILMRAVEAVTALLDEVRRLRDEVERLRWERDAMCGKFGYLIEYSKGYNQWWWCEIANYSNESEYFDTASDALADLRRHLKSEGQA